MYIQANHYTPINVKLHYHIQLQAEVGEGGDLHSRKKQIPTNSSTMKCLQFITMKEGLHIDIMTSPYYNWSIPLTISHPQSVTLIMLYYPNTPLIH